MEKSKTDAKEASQVAVAQARLRSDLAVATREKDDALALVAESNRKHELTKEELCQTKAKLAKAEQEKVKLERDRRVTMSWAKSVDTNISTGSDFYKRKVRGQA